MSLHRGNGHTNGGAGGPVPAVGYCRMSTDRQEASIPEQEKAIAEYAARQGYRIVRWYKDEGISGDDTRRRKAFLQMIADAGDRRDFDAIICWDKARFGRFDSIEAGYYIFPLRQVGIHLATVTEGVTDWNDSTHRIVGSVTQEGKHQQLIDHSANVTRGQLGAALNGSWNGSAPYGYRIEGDRKHKRLVLGDPAKVKVVERIFREFVKDNRSLNSIAVRLNADGVPSPTGRKWMHDSVKVILGNPAYTGDFVGSRWYYGKYHQIHHENNHAEVRKTRGAIRGRNPSEKWIIRPATHDAIIDRDTFDRAQAILAKGKTGRNRVPPEKNPYVFSSCLRCGRCGRNMAGLTKGKYRYYECTDYKRPRPDPDDPSKDRPSCPGTTVREDVILSSLADHLENWLGPEYGGIDGAAYYGAIKKEEDLPAAYFDLKRLLTRPPQPKVDRKRLEGDLRKLTGQVTKMRANLALLEDPGNIPAVERAIREVDEQRAALERQLKETAPPSEADVNKVVEGIMWTLVNLVASCRALAQPEEVKRNVSGSVESAAPHNVRWLLRQTDGIVVYTSRRGAKTRVRHDFERGELVFRRVGANARDLNPHLPL